MDTILKELWDKANLEDKILLRALQREIKAKLSIDIPFSEEDLSALQNGETFDWTFNEVDVHLYQGEED